MQECFLYFLFFKLDSKPYRDLFIYFFYGSQLWGFCPISTCFQSQQTAASSTYISFKTTDTITVHQTEDGQALNIFAVQESNIGYCREIGGKKGEKKN